MEQDSFAVDGKRGLSFSEQMIACCLSFLLAMQVKTTVITSFPCVRYLKILDTGPILKN